MKIIVKASDVNFLYIANMNPGKETFTLMSRVFDGSDVVHKINLHNSFAATASSFRLLDVVAAEKTFFNISEAVTNVEVRSLSISTSTNDEEYYDEFDEFSAPSTSKNTFTKQRGVQFAFVDTGACATLLSVKVFYVVCSATTSRFAFFPLTVTSGKQPTSVTQVSCECGFNQINVLFYLKSSYFCIVGKF